MLLYELAEFLLKKKISKNIYVVSSDRLPSNFSLPAGLIVNLSPSTHPGSHWIAIYIDVRGNGVYFCSFGMRPKVKSIQNFLKLRCKSVRHNPVQLQRLSSTFCGQYSAVFLFYAFQGVELKTFLKHFSRNLSLNDNLIVKMFHRLNKYVN